MKRSRILVSALALAVALAGAACGGSSADEAAPPVSFAADPEAGGSAVFLRGRAERDRIFVDVLARGLADVHGTAFRVTWDPEALAFVEAQPSGTWSSKAVLLAKEPVAGQLAVAWTEKGESAGHDATLPIVLGTLVFDAKGRRGTALAFRAERSTVVDRLGRPAIVAWRAGSVRAR